MQNLNPGNVRKPRATLDDENNRYIIRPIDGSKPVTVKMVLRSIKETTHTTWRNMAEWIGVKKQSDVFKLTYCDGLRTVRNEVAQFITVSGDVAYFYDKDHKPTSAETPVVHPTLVNSETDVITVTAKMPSLVTSRVTIQDPVERILELSVSVPVGYLVSADRMLIATPGTTIVKRGTARKLNEFLKNLKYTSTEFGDQEITITVDDRTGVAAGILTTSVIVTVVAGETVSVPSITVPAEVTLAEEGDTTIPAIVVTDEANQLLNLRITPYGCELYDIKNYMGYVADGELYTAKGTATSLTDSLKAVKVRTKNDEAQILMELVVSGVAHLRETISLAAAAAEEGPATPPPPTSDTATADNTVLGE